MKMSLCSQRICSRLPGTLSFLSGRYNGTFLRLSPVHMISTRAFNLPVFSTFKDFHDFQFHFAHVRNVRLHSSFTKCPAVGDVITKKTNGNVSLVCQRNKSKKRNEDTQSDQKSLTKARENPYAHLTVGQKVKEVGKDASYTVVILVGIAVTGFMFYMIGRELFSSQSPSGVYGDALSKCQNNIEVISALGEPLKGYGETSRRGRRRHVSHTEFEVRGVPHMRLRFYIEGPYRKATVHVEVKKGESGKYEYRYLVVETEGYPHRTFVLEDNR